MKLPKVKYKVHITKVESGETRIIEESNGSVEYVLYWWTEGNGGCDCNREILFERFAGNEIESESCGHGRFKVSLEFGLIDCNEQD